MQNTKKWRAGGWYGIGLLIMLVPSAGWAQQPEQFPSVQPQFKRTGGFFEAALSRGGCTDDCSDVLSDGFGIDISVGGKPNPSLGIAGDFSWHSLGLEDGDTEDQLDELDADWHNWLISFGPSLRYHPVPNGAFDPYFLGALYYTTLVQSVTASQGQARAEVESTAWGPGLALGAGFDIFLSNRVALHFKFVYNFVMWYEVCVDGSSTDSNGRQEDESKCTNIDDMNDDQQDEFQEPNVYHLSGGISFHW